MVALTVYHVKGPELSTAAVIRFGTVLPDGRTYQAKLHWLKYEAYWLLSWADVTGETILNGVRVVANFNLFFPYSDPRLPDGHLICHDTTNKREAPRRDDWRERHMLLFAPSFVSGSPDTVNAAVVVE